VINPKNYSDFSQSLARSHDPMCVVKN